MEKTHEELVKSLAKSVAPDDIYSFAAHWFSTSCFLLDELAKLKIGHDNNNTSIKNISDKINTICYCIQNNIKFIYETNEEL